MKAMPFLALAMLGLLAVAPNAVAFHGAYYKATGVAEKGNVPYLVTVEWVGYWPCPCFKVTIQDISTHAIVEQRMFTGTHTFQGPAFSFWEAFVYHGWSTDPSVSFDIQGTFVNTFNLPPYPGQMVYAGNYEDYQVQVVVVVVNGHFVDLTDPTHF